MNDYRRQLEVAGVVVTSRWLTDPTPELTEAAWQLLANKDVEDIRRADGLALFAESGRPGAGGRHVKFGIAMGLEKRLIVVGSVENLVHQLLSVQVVPTWDEAFAALTLRDLLRDVNSAECPLGSVGAEISVRYPAPRNQGQGSIRRVARSCSRASRALNPTGNATERSAMTAGRDAVLGAPVMPFGRGH